MGLIKISNYIDPGLVCFLKTKTQLETLQALVDRLLESGRVSDRELFFKLILEREKLVTTGIGMGVAIPHAKLSSCEDFSITIGILEKGVEWGALDRAPVRLVFMISGPDDRQTEYLQLLSALTSHLKSVDVRKGLLACTNPDAVVELFK
jgi:PTS system nitrogen regulatory IIA component